MTSTRSGASSLMKMVPGTSRSSSSTSSSISVITSLRKVGLRSPMSLRASPDSMMRCLMS
ncbi:hypothetical protein D3C71_1841860 [compost metagenome]